MSADLEDKSGDEFDQAFLASMIEHHDGALDMAKLASTRARHREIRELSRAIVAAQEAEIARMQRWQVEWGYDTDTGADHATH